MDLFQPSLADWFGDIDIYLFDQLLKGRITPGMRVLDAGCGTGRNLVYFLRTGHQVFGVDGSAGDIKEVRNLAARLAPGLPRENFRCEDVRELSFADDSFDLVISNAVLHFAADEPEFDAMLTEMWRVLKPGGMLFARLASTIGIEDRVKLLDGRRYTLPDGSERFLVDEDFLQHRTDRLGGSLIEPLKTVVVQSRRCMTTWCVRKATS